MADILKLRELRKLWPPQFCKNVQQCKHYQHLRNNMEHYNMISTARYLRGTRPHEARSHTQEFMVNGQSSLAFQRMSWNCQGNSGELAGIFQKCPEHVRDSVNVLSMSVDFCNFLDLSCPPPWRNQGSLFGPGRNVDVCQTTLMRGCQIADSAHNFAGNPTNEPTQGLN